MSDLSVQTRVTCHEVSCMPYTSVNRRSYVIEVRLERHGWAVVHSMRYLGTDGLWSNGYDGPFSNREAVTDDERQQHSDHWDAWMAAHHFDEQTALRLAQEAAPHIIASGMTPAQVLAWEATR